jgi:hypothetical protein
MKHFAISLIGILALSMLSSRWPTVARQDQPAKAPRTPTLVFKAKATKPVYSRGEAVEFNFTLRNGGQDTLIVAKHLQLSLNVKLEIIDAEGKPAKWCGRIAEIFPSKDLYRTLSPGESLSSKLNVACANQDDPGRAWGYSLSVPGKYVVKSSYRLPQPKEVFDQLFPYEQVPQGPVSAKPVTIELQ